ncbi:hypothetical protein CY35_03G135400 [Sphagnum magellanicum]|nr:hypothetical protein CY35_03G135400 [Sphagnum magellanicum]
MENRRSREGLPLQMANTESNHLFRWTLSISQSILLVSIVLQPRVVEGKSFQNAADLLLVDRKFVSLNDRFGSSILGDPGMTSEKVRVAVEGWDFCNRAGDLSSGSPSPRWADCADLQCISSSTVDGFSTCNVSNEVTDKDNELQSGDPFPITSFLNPANADLYAVEKEKYLASLCEVDSGMRPWYFWMVMLKNGNFDEASGLCKSFATKPMKFFNPRTSAVQGSSGFPCFGSGCMNQPLVYHNWSSGSGNGVLNSQSSLTGSFYGTYDLHVESPSSLTSNASYFSVSWKKNTTSQSWIFHHILKASPNYPWLMLYLRADTTSGISGGYPWDTRGMMQQVPVSPNFTVIITLDVIQGGGPQSQFYLIDIGGCWKNNGGTCDGDVDSDVTRYVEMIINPQTPSWCRPDSLDLCPLYHVSINGTKIYREDTTGFPYSAYHLYCSPPNAAYAESPAMACDPYSNPQAQEIVQLLPHPEWAVHGYPSKQGDGWVGDSRTWTLDVGALSNRLYFYQDPGTEQAIRSWPSIDVGTEMFNADNPDTAEWTVSDFDVLIP